MEQEKQPEINKAVNHNLGVVLADGEEVVGEIKKHSIGVFISAFIGSIITIAVIGISLFFYGYVNSNSSGNSSLAAITVFLVVLLSLGILIATLINIYLFKMNSLIITTEKVAQIMYKTIFNRKVIQLSIERVQDVTVSQVGILPRIFKYGTIIIETAGEQEDCVFTFAPSPYETSRTIMDLHEKAVVKSRSII